MEQGVKILKQSSGPPAPVRCSDNDRKRNWKQEKNVLPLTYFVYEPIKSELKKVWKSPLHVAEPKKYNTDLVNVNDQAL